MVLSARDLKRLEGVHPDLVRLLKRAAEITEVPFRVLEGVRTSERQAALMKAGASMTRNSRHLTGHAVDLGAVVSGSIRWDWPLYHKLGATLKAAAQEINLPIEWGGDWKVFKDGTHFQLPRKTHPYNERKIT
jgi:peptidoglycan L-alanyl-D-glutamate endopeptidase CwlK